MRVGTAQAYATSLGSGSAARKRDKELWPNPSHTAQELQLQGSVQVVRLRSLQSQGGSLPLCGWSALLHTPASKTPVKRLYNPDLYVYWALRKYVCAGEEGGAFNNLAKLNVL